MMHEGRLGKDPGVDTVQDEFGFDRDVDDGSLLGTHALDTAKIGDEFGAPRGERAAYVLRIDRARPERLDRVLEGDQAVLRGMMAPITPGSSTRVEGGHAS